MHLTYVASGNAILPVINLEALILGSPYTWQPTSHLRKIVSAAQFRWLLFSSTDSGRNTELCQPITLPSRNSKNEGG